jgi:hypothetical protein
MPLVGKLVERKKENNSKSHFEGMKGWVNDAEKAYKSGNKKMAVNILKELKKNIDKTIRNL